MELYMDINEYLVHRLNRLEVRPNKREISGLINNFGVSSFEELKNAIPLDWIRESTLATEDSEPLIEYSTETGMELLRKVHRGEKLSQSDDRLLNKITAALQSDLLPRPDKDFMVIRGGNYSNLEPGQIITNKGPFSSTFSYAIAEYYKPAGCCVAEIIIPAGSPVTYVDMLDQVIFPPKSMLRVMSTPFIKRWYKEDSKTYTEELTIRLEYIGNNS